MKKNRDAVYNDLVNRDTHIENPTIQASAADRHLSKKYLTTRSFLSLLSNRKKEIVKWWQRLEPHYTDLLAEQLDTKANIDYLESLANYAFERVRKVYLWCLPINILIFGLLYAFIDAPFIAMLAAKAPWTFRLLFLVPVALSFTSVPLWILGKRIIHTHTYSRIDDKLVKTNFKYFDIGDADPSPHGGLTKTQIHGFLKKRQPNIRYTPNEIARYLQKILEVEIERKPRGTVYFVQLRDKYEKHFQDLNTHVKP